MGKASINIRVQIIDDEEIVRDNIEEILVPKKQEESEIIISAASILFDDDDEQEPILSTANHQNIPVFKVDKAINGMDGVDKIKQSIKEGSPYDVVFLDMRMPGWIGNGIVNKRNRYES